MSELPTFTASSYTSNAIGPEQWLKGDKADMHNIMGAANMQANMQQLLGKQAAAQQPQPKEPQVSARIVKVYIADPNENLPLENRVLYTGAEQLTDLTDQELFFEVPISDLLAKHNEMRKTVVDKKQAEKFGRDIFLEPARIRDLKMVVVSVATF